MIGRAVIRYLSAATVLTVAVAGGLLSYHALHELAVSQHIPGDLSWLWPIAIDGLLIVGGFVVLYDELERESTTVGWLIVLAGTAFSVAVQALQVAEPTLLSVLVWGFPPAALAVSWWLLMRMIRRHLRPSGRSSARTRAGSRQRPVSDPARVGDRSRHGQQVGGSVSGVGPGDGAGATGRVDRNGLPGPRLGQGSGHGPEHAGRLAGLVEGSAQRSRGGPVAVPGADSRPVTGGRGESRDRARELVAAERSVRGNGWEPTGTWLSAALATVGVSVTDRQARRLLGRLETEREPFRLEVVGGD